VTERKETRRASRLRQIRRRFSYGSSMVRRMTPERRVALLQRERKQRS
jgi:hypothetical protein